jgi:prepilin-type N-terminal cleavage/methylation domain-containing protein/prepilin-type processing-associated H-X9-DG protein
MKRRRAGFTLVELLVVIGIIAVLVGILLPALGAARRQANAVKCATSLREIGNAFAMYAIDNRGYFPPAKTLATYRLSFGDTDSVDKQFWTGFLAKYVTKAKMGTASATATEAADAQRTVFWGCPTFEGYVDPTQAGGVYRVQTGYGMNAFPEYKADYPKPANPPNVLGDFAFSPTNDVRAVATPNTTNNWATLLTTAAGGKWYKQKDWTSASRRVLVADAIFWLLEVQAAPLNGVLPGQRVAANNPGTITWYSPSGNGQTLYDFYRHGKYPGIEKADANLNGYYSTSGGKVGFNVLFADGHVSTLTSREEGYMAARMRYPG